MFPAVPSACSFEAPVYPLALVSTDFQKKGVWTTTNAQVRCGSVQVVIFVKDLESPVSSWGLLGENSAHRDNNGVLFN